jgi:hypothetical protein
MTQLSFLGAISMIIVSELLIAIPATWLHEISGGTAALIFTMGGMAAWLNLLPEIVSASEES